MHFMIEYCLVLDHSLSLLGPRTYQWHAKMPHMMTAEHFQLFTTLLPIPTHKLKRVNEKDICRSGSESMR